MGGVLRIGDKVVEVKSWGNILNDTASRYRLKNINEMLEYGIRFNREKKYFYANAERLNEKKFNILMHKHHNNLTKKQLKRFKLTCFVWCVRLEDYQEK